MDSGEWRLRIGGTEHSGKVVDRLAAYEDTGMEPEAVEYLKLASMGKAIAELKEFNGVPIGPPARVNTGRQRGAVRGDAV